MTRIGITLCFLICILYCIYGTPIPKNRIGIFGGHNIPIRDAPYMASFRKYNATSKATDHVCGASIIHSKFLLTAAHCYYMTIMREPKYMVMVGTNKINEGGVLYDVAKIVPHKKFKTDEFDIALIKLTKRITFGPNVAKLSLPYKKPHMHEGLAVNATGWGKTETSLKSLSEDLRQVELQIVGRNHCIKAFEHEKDVRITKKMICAGGNGEDTCQIHTLIIIQDPDQLGKYHLQSWPCQGLNLRVKNTWRYHSTTEVVMNLGDSGGPLTTGNILIGVTSFGVGCGLTPGVYTQVSKMLPWIVDTIGIL